VYWQHGQDRAPLQQGLPQYNDVYLVIGGLDLADDIEIAVDGSRWWQTAVAMAKNDKGGK
jgi:hypothetical protein